MRRGACLATRLDGTRHTSLHSTCSDPPPRLPAYPPDASRARATSLTDAACCSTCTAPATAFPTSTPARRALPRASALNPVSAGDAKPDSANTRRSLVMRAWACHRALQQTHQATRRHKTPRALESAARMQAQRGCKRYQLVTSANALQWRSRASSRSSENATWSSCARHREDRNAAALSGHVLSGASTWQLTPMRAHRCASIFDIGLHRATKNGAIAAIDCAAGDGKSRVLKARSIYAIAAQMPASAAASRSY